MSVDTKLILCVGDSELALVGKVVLKALSDYVKALIQEEPKAPIGLPDGYESPRIYSFDFETFVFRLATKVDGRRMVFMHLGCSEDEEELVGGKNYIVFSLGAWGGCVNIMQVLKTTLTPLGSVYHLANDSDGEWERV